MKLTGLKLEQFMRVECVEMSFSPSGAIVIGGDNGSGKTSVETFLELCFGKKCPAMPVKVGAKKSIGKLTLDNDGHCVTIEAEVSPDRTVKAIVRQDGGKAFDGPMTMLKSLVSKFTFRPFDLLALTGQEQRRVMLDCLGVNFDDLEAKVETIKEERKQVGRDRNGRERQIASMVEFAGVPAKELNVSALAKQLTEAHAHNQKCKAFQDAVTEWQSEIAFTNAKIDDLNKHIAELQQTLAERQALLIEAKDGLRKAESEASQLVPVDVAPIQKKLTDADAINAKVRANKARAALVEQYQQDHDRYKELGEQIDAIEIEKQQRLNAAKCPVQGLEFRDDGVWYQGLPLAQDMESDQMIRAVQLSAALNPTLRAICIDNAERMLPAKMKELNDWAEANDYQVFAFRASATPEGCAFYLEEGKVANG